MKKLLILFVSAGTLALSCSKNSTAPNSGGNGGGGNNNTLTVTSITPSNPYPDDEFTIHGTGFNTDITKDTVEFGHASSGIFVAWHDGLPIEYPSLCTVVSATATTLVVKAVNPFAVDVYSFQVSPVSIAVAQVRVGGKKVVTPLLPFKRLLVFSGIANPEQYNSSIGRPGDSMEITGKGFVKNGLTISIGSTALSSLKIDSVSGFWKVYLRLPKSFFGEENDETKMEDKPLSIKNADGKTIQAMCHFYLSPTMAVSSVNPASKTYSLGNLTSTGGKIRVVINGRALKNDAIIKLSSVNGVHVENNLPVAGFPDQTAIEYGAAGLLPGTYGITVSRANTLYATGSFSVTQ